MANHLNKDIGSMEYDKLFADQTPQALVGPGVIRKLGVAATYARGTVLAKSSIDSDLVILGTEAQAAVEAADPVYGLTEDTAIVSGKTYYTRSGSAGAYVYTPVASPAVENVSTYYEMTTPAVEAQDAEILTPDCVLCDDVAVGTAADVVVAVYTAANINVNALTVKSGYTMTESDKDKLRERGIYLGVVWPM